MNDFSIKDKPVPNPPPHVVLLGAGASRAAFPKGDRNGRKLPLMNELSDVLGANWNRLVTTSCVPEGDFESQYSWLKSQVKYAEELTAVELRIKQYFEEMELPDHPTIYDYLVLGLRSSDVIGTFNWDPLLLQALDRNKGVCKLPDLRFLHGCVSYTTCEEHDVLGMEGQICPICRSALITGQLYYPETDKDYARDSFIKRDWDMVKKAVKHSFHLTVFGYSAPKTDYNARQILLDAWGDETSRGMCHVELIDTASPAYLSENWSSFIPYDHMMHVTAFYDSSIARWPRRTFEWKRNASFYGVPSLDVGICKTESLQELQDWFRELGELEAANPNVRDLPQESAGDEKHAHAAHLFLLTSTGIGLATPPPLSQSREKRHRAAAVQRAGRDERILHKSREARKGMRGASATHAELS